jgi:hypothetical protein
MLNKWFRSWRTRRASRRSVAGKTGGIFIYDSQPNGEQVLTEAIVPVGKKLVMVSVTGRPTTEKHSDR